MGVLDKLMEIKKNHEAKVALEQERIRKEREKRRQEEAAMMEQLKSGKLVQEIYKRLRTSSWFSQSQGTWDCNCRQVIVTPVTVYINNHDKDVFFQYLRNVEPDGEKGVISTIQRELYVSLKDIGGSSIAVKSPTPETQYVDETLEKYEKSNNFKQEVLPFQMWGFAPISDRGLLKKVAIALREVLAEGFPSLTFSELQKNKYGFWMFETKVSPKEATPLMSQEEPADVSDLELRLELKQIQFYCNSEKITLIGEQMSGKVNESTVEKIVGYEEQIIGTILQLKNTNDEDKKKLDEHYLNLGEVLYDGYGEGKTISTEEQHNKLVYAQENFAKVLPLEKEEYNIGDVRITLKYLATLEKIFHYEYNDVDQKYLDAWNETASLTYVRSRKLVNGFNASETKDMRIFYQNLDLLDKLICIKCILDDLDEAEEWLKGYIACGAAEDRIELYTKVIQARRERNKS